MSADIVALARGWVGTPYHHRARLRGVGVDCLGLVCGLWPDATGRSLPCAIPPYGPAGADTGHMETLWRALAQHLRMVDMRGGGFADGQVLLFRVAPRGWAMHLGIQTGGGQRFIHACPRAGVIEAPLSRPWARRIVARFEFPHFHRTE